MICLECATPAVPGARFCSRCGRPLAPLPSALPIPAPGPAMVRPRFGRRIAGVCLAFSLHFGWDVTLIRVLLVLFTLLTWGTGVLLYAAAWLVLPDERFALQQSAGAGWFGPPGGAAAPAPSAPGSSAPAPPLPLSPMPGSATPHAPTAPAPMSPHEGTPA